jgi:hypothetical protein
VPIKKLVQKAGVNRENTRYTNESGYYESEKVRFRQGTPEKIGGWVRISAATFLGVCRSLWNWITLGGANLLGVGTNLKFYIESGGAYNDITPIRASSTINNNPFVATNGSAVITVTDTAHGAATNDFVTFSGAVGLGGNITATVLNANYQITVLNDNSYTFIASATANATDASGSPGGGASVVAAYEISVGSAAAIPAVGWGAGGWGLGKWGESAASLTQIRIWSQSNFGEDLIFAPNGGGIYVWDAASITTRGVLISSLGGTVSFTNASPTVVTATTVFTSGTPVQFSATGSLPTGVTAATTYYITNVSGITFNITNSNGTLINTTSTGSGVSISLLVDVPSIQSFIFVSDASRFTFAFGCNDYGSATQNPMLIRWSNQEDYLDWTPAATNQAGSLTLSHGSKIVTALQARQEILVFTDSTLYSLQYAGPPAVWGSQLLGDNISIVGQNAAALASGVCYWMGVDKFYKYDGRVQTLRCDLLRFVYTDINFEQDKQFFASTNEGFNEVWFFYCSAGAEVIDRYVIYNYAENQGAGVWSYGTLGRTAWLDSGLRNYPLAATYSYNIVNHEFGVDNGENETVLPIYAMISTTEFDIDDGNRFGFVRRILPDLTFEGSTAANPQITLTLTPMQNSGSGFNNPQSVGGDGNALVTRSATVPIEAFTGQVFIRVRGRQMILTMESNQLGCAWQSGAHRLDIRQDGGRGNT